MRHVAFHCSYRYNYELRSEFIGLTYYNSSYEIMWPLGRRADRTHTLISGTLFDPKGYEGGAFILDSHTIPTT